MHHLIHRQQVQQTPGETDSSSQIRRQQPQPPQQAVQPVPITVTVIPPLTQQQKPQHHRHPPHTSQTASHRVSKPYSNGKKSVTPASSIPDKTPTHYHHHHGTQPIQNSYYSTNPHLHLSFSISTQTHHYSHTQHHRRIISTYLT